MSLPNPSTGIGHRRVHPNDLRDHYTSVTVDQLVDILRRDSAGETAFVDVMTSSGTVRVKVFVED